VHDSSNFIITEQHQPVAHVNTCFKFNHRTHQHAGYTFTPASLKTYDYLGKSLVGYLRTLSAVAAGCTLGVSRGSFSAIGYREFSVALVCSQGFVYCAGLYVLRQPSGSGLWWTRAGCSNVPLLDRVDAVRRLVVICVRALSCLGQCLTNMCANLDRVHLCMFVCVCTVLPCAPCLPACFGRCLFCALF
jgi:hypothetical protein